MMPVITEKGGVVKFQDLVEGKSLAEQTDEATGIAQRVVIEFRGTAPQGGSASAHHPARRGKGEARARRRATCSRRARCCRSRTASGRGRRGARPRIPRSAKTRDITGGLPRVAELFEARKPKERDHRRDLRPRRVRQGLQEQAPIAIIPDEGGEPVEYLIPKGKHIDVQEGDYVKGDNLIDGSPDPHDILAVLGVEALAEYLVNEIQEVYRLQGVKINDKHIEVIVRQMLQKVEITESGDTTFLVGEQVDKHRDRRGQREG
jgi:DNA-directed RNA polymerase subunit beta'